MNTFRNWANRIAAWSNHLTAALLFSMFIVFIMQIVFRYLLGWPVLWTVEWVTIAWLWGILFSFAFVINTSEMIRLDIVYYAVPRGMQRAFDVFSGLTTAGIFIWTLPDAWDYITFMRVERTAAFLWPFDLIFSIYIPFHIAVIVRMLLVAWSGLFARSLPEELETHPESHTHD